MHLPILREKPIRIPVAFENILKPTDIGPGTSLLQLSTLEVANIDLIWASLWVPSATMKTYAAYSLWPAYSGIVAGALVWRYVNES
jgi:hypothetical protein